MVGTIKARTGCAHAPPRAIRFAILSIMKIKVKPEDFIVEEITDLRPGEGDFGLYLLEKRGWNTVDLLKRLSRELRIPFSDLSYGGKKDRHALTRQLLTIKAQKAGGEEKGHIELSEDNYSLRFVGFVDRPMGPDLIRGNRFELTIRDLVKDEVHPALSGIELVSKVGFPNYFDDQRFGSFDTRQGFIAEKILKGHYNGALKIFLTHIRPEDRGEDKERKRFFFDHWRDWQACFEKAASVSERDTFGVLVKDPEGFVPVLQRVAREEMSLFFSAYQSSLWNDILRRVVKEKVRSVCVYPGIAGDYLFYTDPDPEAFRYLKGLEIPTPASGVTMPDALTEALYSEVLADNGMKPSLFNIRKIRQAFFKSTERAAIVVPEDMSFDVSADELYKGKQKMTLRFILPRGSYATMFIKRLFSRG